MQQRLQKIIAEAGLASRREAEKMILDGRVNVNNQVMSKLGVKASADKDTICVDGKIIHAKSEKIYIMLHKPKGYVTTLNDPLNRPIVSDLLVGIPDRVFPVGRLDCDSQGLLLMTNDGDFAQRIIHPRFQISKVYKVKIRGKISNSYLQCLKMGVKLKDGVFKPDQCHIIRVNNKSSWLLITLKEGKNRIIRRALEYIGFGVIELIRIRIGNLDLNDLKKGQYRFLSKGNVEKIFNSKEQNKKFFLD